MDDLIDGTYACTPSMYFNKTSVYSPYRQFYKSPETATECKEPLVKYCKNRTNLIIFDFDDTVFPTYLFRTQQHEKDKEFGRKLKILALLIEKTFLKMIKLYGASNIIIVTNGSENWIYKCLNVDIVQDTLMNFQNLLNKYKIKTISASTKENRNKYPKNHYKWKQIVFSEVFKEHFKTNNKNMVNSVTSIGDSLYEYKASDISSKYLSNRILNRIRFKPEPSMNDLIFEMTETCDMIEQFGSNIDDIELDYCNIFTPTYYSSYSDTTC